MSTSGLWSLCDDSAPYGDHVKATGTEDAVKALHRSATDDSEGTIKIALGSAYVEDPAGNQYDWNPHTKEWDEL